MDIVADELSDDGVGEGSQSVAASLLGMVGERSRADDVVAEGRAARVSKGDDALAGFDGRDAASASGLDCVSLKLRRDTLVRDSFLGGEGELTLAIRRFLSTSRKLLGGVFAGAIGAPSTTSASVAASADCASAHSTTSASASASASSVSAARIASGCAAVVVAVGAGAVVSAGAAAGVDTGRGCARCIGEVSGLPWRGFAARSAAPIAAHDGQTVADGEKLARL